MKPLSEAARSVPRSGIRKLLDQAAKVPDAIHLEIGQPNFDTPPHIIEAAHRAALEGYTGYTANAGLPSLRQAIADKVARENGLPASSEHVTVTVGGMGALFTTFRVLLDPGDQVLMPDPGWVNYEQMALMCDAEVVRYPLSVEHGFQPRLEVLPDLITPRTKILLINSPSNPTGAVIPARTSKALVDLAREYDLYVVSDECYEKIVFDAEHVSPGLFDADGRVVSVFSFSKAYAMTGWRVGWVISHPDIAQVLAKLQEGTVSCASSVSQKAAEAALTGPQNCVQTMVDAYRLRRDRAMEILRAYGLASYVPQGAFYVLVGIGGCGLDSDRFAEQLLEERHVAVAPGSTFGPLAANTVRISLATAMDQLEAGLERLCQAIVQRREEHP